MSSVCPNGHTSTADDYCDVCGVPIDSAQQPATASPAVPPATAAATGTTGALACPHCGTENVAEALFCEACGYDFTTGTLPRTESGAEAPNESGAEAPNESGAEAPNETGAEAPNGKGPTGGVDAPPSASTPRPPGMDAGTFGFVAEVWIDPAWYQAQQSPDPNPSPGLPEIVPLRKSSVLVGRVSRSRNIHPEIDCEPDSGVSRRQCQLTTDGTRWWVEDLESANGTFVAGGSEPLPSSPIPVGLKQEIQSGDRVYVGAWTRIVVRAATSEEQESLV